MQAELMAPVAKSPLDSARGRGKVRSASSRRCTPKSTEKSSDGPKAVVIFFTQNEKQLIEVKHVK
jgi:hypothetical protein